MLEQVLMRVDEGKMIYGHNIGKMYVKDNTISIPEETLQAIRDASFEGECILDGNLCLLPSNYRTEIEIVHQDKVEKIKGFVEDIREVGTFSDVLENPPIGYIKFFINDGEWERSGEAELIIGYKDVTLIDGSINRKFYIINMNSNKWLMRECVPYKALIEEQRVRGKYTEMHLKEDPYYKILSGLKIYELRLWDEKRQNLSVGDIIKFTKLSAPAEDIETDCFYTQIKKLKRYDSFSDLYDAADGDNDHITLYRCGSPKGTSKQDFLDRMENYYSKEKQSRYGVVAIELEVIYSPETERRVTAALEKAEKRRPITKSIIFDDWNGFNGIYFRALCLAELAHRNVKRKMSDINFICHPYEVGSIVKDIIYREKIPFVRIVNRVVAAGVLHDVVEDTDYTIDDITEIFDESTSRYVAEETENKRRDKKARDTWRIRKEEFLKMLSKAEDYPRIITLADKLSNMRDMKVDYQELGDGLWLKFNNNNVSDHAWYYRRVAKELARNVECEHINKNYPVYDNPEYEELVDLIEEVFGKL